MVGSNRFTVYFVTVLWQQSGFGHYMAHWSLHGSFLGGHPWVVTPVAETGNMDRGGGSFARTPVSWLCNPHLVLNLPVSFACKFVCRFILFLLFCYFLAEISVGSGLVGGLAQNC